MDKKTTAILSFLFLAYMAWSYPIDKITLTAVFVAYAILAYMDKIIFR